MLKYKKKREYEVIMTIDIPGYRTLHLKNLLLDYNGTIAVDGSIPQDVRPRLCQLSEYFDIYVLTADTHGTAAQMCDGLPLTIRTFPKGSALDAKHQILKELGPDSCAAIGNGRNDMKMCLDAASMAANDVFHMGPKTAPLFAAAYSKYIGKIARTAIEDTPDMEYTWAKIDERLQQIYGENFQPHEVRYGG